jgi:hypothetical protein
MGNDAVVLEAPRGLTVVDTVGRLRRTLPVPDSLAVSSTPYVDAVSRSAAYWSTSAGAVIVADLTTGKLARAFASKTAMRPVGEAADGSLFVTTYVSADSGAAPGDTTRRHQVVLGRIRPGSVGFVRVATLPQDCVLDLGVIGIAVDRGGTRASCTERRFTPDVWLADKAGKSGW